MFEIIDTELITFVDEKQRLPSRFPTKRLPSTKIFNRIEDLWILILRCWDVRPKRRPQSWEVHDRIDMLIKNPLNIVSENEDYETQFPSHDQNLPSCNSFPVMPTGCTETNTVLEEDIELSPRSLMPESPMSSMFGEPESPESIGHLIMRDFIDKFAKGNQLKIQMNGDKTSNKKQKRFKLNTLVGEKVRNGNHLSLPCGTPSPNTHMLSPSIKLRKWSSLNFSSQRKMSDQSISNCQLSPYRRMKFLKRLGSLSSLVSPTLSAYSQSLTSLDEESMISERVQYCSPLSASFKSEATNIRYCGDRHFFQTSQEKAKTSQYLHTPESELVEESPSACNLITITGETPRFLVVV